jgi:hypothetical protein
MGARMPATDGEGRGDLTTRRAEEADWMLQAIAGAIAAGKLPPDDACAWAKIAAYEVEALWAGGTLTLTGGVVSPPSR